MATKKELKEQYKQMKPEMGIFQIRSDKSGKCILYAVQDLKSRMNRFRFALDMGSHPNRELQQEWDSQGAEHFIFEVIDRLDYDEDESKTDYSEDLELMKMEWEERFNKENRPFYSSVKETGK